MAIHYFINLFEKEIINKYKVFKSDINIEMLKRQIVIAFPVGMQEILSMMSLVVFYSIIKIIGTIELAATHVIFKIMHASFMPAIGVGQACATLVGKFLGENNPDKSESAINESLRGSMYIMGTIGILFIPEFAHNWPTFPLSDAGQPRSPAALDPSGLVRGGHRGRGPPARPRPPPPRSGGGHPLHAQPDRHPVPAPGPQGTLRAARAPVLPQRSGRHRRGGHQALPDTSAQGPASPLVPHGHPLPPADRHTAPDRE